MLSDLGMFWFDYKQYSYDKCFYRISGYNMIRMYKFFLIIINVKHSKNYQTMLSQ